MRDYKNVKIPRKYRTQNKRTVNRRVDLGPVRSKRPAAFRSALGTALSLLVTAGLCYGAWAGYRWLTHAEMFQIAGVDVLGLRRVSEEAVREAAGSFTGQNIFSVDISAAARRIGANPWVREAVIERSLPNRIRMEITERAPRAVLQASNGRFLMDNEGVVIIPVRDGDPLAAGLPGIVLREHRAAPRSSVDGAALPAALQLLDALADRGGWDLGSVAVRADSPETIAVLYAGREFRIGTGNYPEKLRRLGEIVSDMHRRGLEYTYVELRPERQAAVMVAKNTKAEGRKVRR